MWPTLLFGARRTNFRALNPTSRILHKYIALRALKSVKVGCIFSTTYPHPHPDNKEGGAATAVDQQLGNAKQLDAINRTTYTLS